MTNQLLLDELIEDMLKINDAVMTIRYEDNDLLLARPALDRWSALEALEHLNITNVHYLTEIENRLTYAEDTSDGIFKPSWLGNLFVKVMKPRQDGTIPYKTRTFARLQPDVDVKYDTIAKFLEDQQRFISFMQSSVSMNLSRNHIPSLVGKILSFRLGDAFRVVVAHNQRHILQMNESIKWAKSNIAV